MDLEKYKGDIKHSLTPKMLVRMSPGSMRKEDSGFRLNPISAFDLNRMGSIYNYETGITGTLGFDYEIESNSNKKFNFSVAQIINQKENKKMSDSSSLNEKLSDLVGSTSYTLNKNFKVTQNFALDQNYNDLIIMKLD